jgi:capsular polysaccharide transport system ATP-binding protein
VIVIENLCKTYVLRGRHKIVADGISVTFPARTSVALLGRNGAGKSSLLRMIAGTMDPDSGSIRVAGSVSWPVGFAGSFHGDLTGRQNARFIGRVYGVDTDELTEYTEDFAELGQHFDLPVKTYSSGMRSRLAFGVSMGIAFDTYLVDEVTSVGDAAFKQKSERVFHERMRESGAIVVSHAMGLVRRICEHGAVLEDGRLTYYDDVEEAIRHHEAIARQHM